VERLLTMCDNAKRFDVAIALGRCSGLGASDHNTISQIDQLLAQHQQRQFLVSLPIRVPTKSSTDLTSSSSVATSASSSPLLSQPIHNDVLSQLNGGNNIGIGISLAASQISGPGAANNDWMTKHIRAIAAMQAGADCLLVIPTWLMALTPSRISRAASELKSNITGVPTAISNETVAPVYSAFALHPLYSDGVCMEIVSFLCPPSLLLPPSDSVSAGTKPTDDDDGMNMGPLITDEQQYKYRCGRGDRLIATLPSLPLPHATPSTSIVSSSSSPSSLPSSLAIPKTPHEILAAACEHYTTAIKLLPNKAEAYRARGLAYHRMNRWRDAHPDLNKALQLLPRSSQDYIDCTLARADCLHGVAMDMLISYSSSLISLASVAMSDDQKEKKKETTIQHCTSLWNKALVDVRTILRIKPKHIRALTLQSMYTAELSSLSSLATSSPTVGIIASTNVAEVD
jgi:hypothetical protein